ncbi:MAG: helix-turn-helix domain-containing protein [Flavobacteriia bacterium]|nr:helix-turn-helix domain-containing protein [Flavobacteriia bacterium]
MAANIITTEDLEQFKVELFSELKMLIESNGNGSEPKEPNQPRWLKSYQVQRLLGISPGTLQTLRINGTIPFTKLGGTILYNQDEIHKLIQSNTRNPFSDGRK